MGSVKIGIIGAMNSEVELLKSKVEGATEHDLAGLVFVEGSIDGVSVIVVKCGVGKVNAAMCAQAARFPAWRHLRHQYGRCRLARQ